MSLAIVHSRALVGLDAPEVTVEVHLANGLPALTIVGLPEAEVREAKDRVRAALQHAGFEFPARKITINLAQQYVNLGYDAEVLMKRLGEIVCHDSFTEMHAFKHHQSIVEEFHATREPWRWMHLVCGAQAAAISFGKNMNAGPDGNRDLPARAAYPVRDMPVGGLIGRVGNSAPFPIGSTTSPIPMPASGRLYLGVNDDFLQDNSGNFDVNIAY